MTPGEFSVRIRKAIVLAVAEAIADSVEITDQWTSAGNSIEFTCNIEETSGINVEVSVRDIPF